MSDSKIKVAIRCRPKIAQEIKKGLEDQWVINGNEITCISPGKKYDESYTFDHILDQTATNQDVYNLVKPIVASVCNGINGTVFAYGQTSSGKTHSIMGKNSDLGIIPQTIIDIFDLISSVKDRNFLVRCSYFELYREKVIDLLNKDGKKLRMVDHVHGGATVNVEETITRTKEELLDVVRIGARNRQFGATAMNQRSSRSHVMLKIIIESSDLIAENDKVANNAPVKISNLFIVDLAGSERVGQTNATGIVFTEGKSINKSLSYLSLVITQLSKNEEHISFRNSKLTRLLSNALGGNSKTLILANITPVVVDDTSSTFKFASFAKKIVNKARINECLSGAVLIKRHRAKEKELVKELDDLKQLNQDLVNGNDLKNIKIKFLEKQLTMVRTAFVCKRSSITRRHTINTGFEYGSSRSALPMILEEPLCEPIGYETFTENEEDLESDMEESESDLDESDEELDDYGEVLLREVDPDEHLNLSRFSLEDEDVKCSEEVAATSSTPTKRLIKCDLFESKDKSYLELEEFIKAEYEVRIESYQEELEQKSLEIIRLTDQVKESHAQNEEIACAMKTLMAKNAEQTFELLDLKEQITQAENIQVHAAPDGDAADNISILANKCARLEEGIQRLTLENEDLSLKLFIASSEKERVDLTTEDLGREYQLEEEIKRLTKTQLDIQKKYDEVMIKNKELAKDIYLKNLETIFRPVVRTNSESSLCTSREKIGSLRRCKSVPAECTRYSDFRIRDLFINLQDVISTTYSAEDLNTDAIREKLQEAMDAICCKNETICELQNIQSQQLSEIVLNCEHISRLERANNKLKAENFDLVETCDIAQRKLTVLQNKEADLLLKLEASTSQTARLFNAMNAGTQGQLMKSFELEFAEMTEKIQDLTNELTSLRLEKVDAEQERQANVLEVNLLADALRITQITSLEATEYAASLKADVENHKTRSDQLSSELAHSRSKVEKLDKLLLKTKEDYQKHADVNRNTLEAELRRLNREHVSTIAQLKEVTDAKNESIEIFQDYWLRLAEVSKENMNGKIRIKDLLVTLEENELQRKKLETEVKILRNVLVEKDEQYERLRQKQKKKLLDLQKETDEKWALQVMEIEADLNLKISAHEDVQSKIERHELLKSKLVEEQMMERDDSAKQFKERIEAAESIISSRDTQLQKIEAEMKPLQQRIDDADSQIFSRDKRLQNMEAEIVQLKLNLGAEQQKYTIAANEREVLSIKLQKSETKLAEIVQLKLNLGAEQQKYTIAANEREVLSIKLQKSETKLAEICQEQDESAKQFNEATEHLSIALNVGNAETLKLKQIIENTESLISSQDKRLEIMEAEMVQLRSNLSEEQEKYNTVANERDVLSIKLQHSENELGQICQQQDDSAKQFKEKTEQNANKLHAEISKLKEIMKDTESVMASRDKRLENLEAEMAQLTSNLAERQEKYNTVASERDAVINQLSECETKLTQVCQERDDFAKQLKEANERRSSQTESIEGTESLIISPQDRRVENIEAEIAQLQRNFEMELEKSEINVEAVKLAEYELKLAEICQEQDESTKKLKEANEQLAANASLSEIEILNLKQNIASQDERLEIMEGDMVQLRLNLVTEQEKYKNIAEERDIIAAELAQLKTELAEVWRQRDDSVRLLKEATEEHAMAITLARTDLIKLNKTLEEKERVISIKTIQLSDQEIAYQQSTRDIENREALNAEKNNYLIDEVWSLKMALASKEALAKEADSEAIRVNKQIKALELQLSDLVICISSKGVELEVEAERMAHITELYNATIKQMKDDEMRSFDKITKLEQIIIDQNEREIDLTDKSSQIRDEDQKKISDLKAQLSEKNEEINQQRAKLDKKIALTNSINTQTSVIEGLKSELNAANVQILQKTNEIFELRLKHEEMSALTSARLTDKINEINELHLKIKELETLTNKTTDQQKEIDMLQCDLRKANAQVLEKTSEISEQRSILKTNLALTATIENQSTSAVHHSRADSENQRSIDSPRGLRSPSKYGDDFKSIEGKKNEESCLLPSRSRKEKRQSTFDENRDLSNTLVECTNCRELQDYNNTCELKIKTLLDENKDLDLESNGAAHEIDTLRMVVDQLTKSAKDNAVSIQQQVIQIGSLIEECRLCRDEIKTLKQANKASKSDVLPSETFLNTEVKRLTEEISRLKIDIGKVTEDRDYKESIIRELNSLIILKQSDLAELGSTLARKSPKVSSPKVLSPRESQVNLIDENTLDALIMPRTDCNKCNKTKKLYDSIHQLRLRLSQVTLHAETSNTDVLEYYKGQCDTLEKKCNALELSKQPKETRNKGVQVVEREMYGYPKVKEAAACSSGRSESAGCVPKEKYDAMKALVKQRTSTLTKFMEEYSVPSQAAGTSTPARAAEGVDKKDEGVGTHANIAIQTSKR